MIIVAAVATLAVSAAATNESLPIALARAAQYCEAAAASPERKIPGNTELFLPGSLSDASYRPLSAAPEIVKRFISVAPMAREASVSSAVRFPVLSGSVWAIAWEYSACDIVVTGSQMVPEAGAAFAKSLPEQAWRQVARRDASESLPLSQHILLKRSPKQAEPNFGTRLKIQWPAESAADIDGIQLEMNFLSGDIGSSEPVK